MSIQRHGTTARYSDSVVHAGTVYLVEVPANLEADAGAQTANLLASIERLLAQAGSDKSQLLMVTIYLADMADYDAMNAVWDAWLPDSGIEYVLKPCWVYLGLVAEPETCGIPASKSVPRSSPRRSLI